MYTHRLVATGTVLQMDFIPFFKIMYVILQIFIVKNAVIYDFGRFHTHEKFVFSLPEFI